MSYQQITIVGNLGSDPELRYANDGKPVCNFSLAANVYGDKTIWHRVAVWGNQAEPCHQYLHKGSKVLVTGTVEPDAYINKAGDATATLEVSAQIVKFLDSREQTGQGEQVPNNDEVPF